MKSSANKTILILLYFYSNLMLDVDDMMSAMILDYWDKPDPVMIEAGKCLNMP